MQKNSLDSRLFALIADLPCREVNDFEYLHQIPSLVGQDPASILFVKDAGVYLGLNLNAAHTLREDPFSLCMLIRLDGRMRTWTAGMKGKLGVDVGQNYLYCFKSLTPSKLTKELEEIFWHNSHHDTNEMIANHCHYDPRWLVSRLSNGDTVYVRDVPETAGYYDVSNSQCQNVGYWKLSLNSGWLKQ